MRIPGTAITAECSSYYLLGAQSAEASGLIALARASNSIERSSYLLAMATRGENGVPLVRVAYDKPLWGEWSWTE